MKARAVCLVLILVASGFSRLASGQNARGFAFPAARANETVQVLRSVANSPETLLKTQMWEVSRELRSIEESRWVGATEGDVVEVFGLYYDAGPKDLQLSLDERPRDRRIEEDIRTLLKIVMGFKKGAVAERVGVPVLVKSGQFRLREVRALARFSAELLAAAEVQPGDDLGDPAWIVVLDLTDAGNNRHNASVATKEVITGPREGWSMSVALPLNSASQLKFDETTEDIVPKDEPDTFYVSLDYTFGDFYLPTKRLPDAVVLKLMLKADREPLDSLGFGVALKPGFFDRGAALHILDRVSPFVAWTFSREDRAKDDGSVEVDARRNSEVRFGVSYDLGQALKWIK